LYHLDLYAYRQQRFPSHENREHFWSNTYDKGVLSIEIVKSVKIRFGIRVKYLQFEMKKRDKLILTAQCQSLSQCCIPSLCFQLMLSMTTGHQIYTFASSD